MRIVVTFEQNDNQTFNVYKIHKKYPLNVQKGPVWFFSVLGFALIHGAKCCKFYRSEGVSGSLPELCITFHLHYNSFALHLKILPREHEMHAMTRFKCHELHLHFMK